jgi:hypothetical protein
MEEAHVDFFLCALCHGMIEIVHVHLRAICTIVCWDKIPYFSDYYKISEIQFSFEFPPLIILFHILRARLTCHRPSQMTEDWPSLGVARSHSPRLCHGRATIPSKRNE